MTMIDVAADYIDEHDPIDPLEAVKWWGEEKGTFSEYETIEGSGEVAKVLFTRNKVEYAMLGQLSEDGYTLNIQVNVHEFEADPEAAEAPDDLSVAWVLNALNEKRYPFLGYFSYSRQLGILHWQGAIVTDAQCQVTIDQTVHFMDRMLAELDQVPDVVLQFTTTLDVVERTLATVTPLGNA